MCGRSVSGQMTCSRHQLHGLRQAHQGPSRCGLKFGKTVRPLQKTRLVWAQGEESLETVLAEW